MNRVESNRIRNLSRGDATADGRRVPAALVSVIGFAVVGYGIAKWAAGDERPSFPAQAVNSSAAVTGESDSLRPGDRPQSGLVSDLQLTGLVTSGPASIAIIAEPGGRYGIYRIGDRICAGVILEELLRDETDSPAL